MKVPYKSTLVAAFNYNNNVISSLFFDKYNDDDIITIILERKNTKPIETYIKMAVDSGTQLYKAVTVGVQQPRSKFKLIKTSQLVRYRLEELRIELNRSNALIEVNSNRLRKIGYDVNHIYTHEYNSMVRVKFVTLFKKWLRDTIVEVAGHEYMIRLIG